MEKQPPTISVADAASRWGISGQRVRVLLAAGRIPGAALVQESRGPVWQIPANSRRPQKIKPGRKPKLVTT